jgi:hypothetical protein
MEEEEEEEVKMLPFLSQSFSRSFHRTAATRLAATSEAEMGAVILLRSMDC